MVDKATSADTTHTIFSFLLFCVNMMQKTNLDVQTFTLGNGGKYYDFARAKWLLLLDYFYIQENELFSAKLPAKDNVRKVS
jgi:hypothetical protein